MTQGCCTWSSACSRRARQHRSQRATTAGRRTPPTAARDAACAALYARHTTSTSSVRKRCVAVASRTAVVMPWRNISKPVQAIIAPLSMQKLQSRATERAASSCAATAQPAAPLVRGEQPPASLAQHIAHHLLQALIACARGRSRRRAGDRRAAGATHSQRRQRSARRTSRSERRRAR